MVYGFDYDMAELTRAKDFSEYDENAWDFMGDDEYYERTSDYNISYYGEDWSK